MKATEEPDIKDAAQEALLRLWKTSLCNLGTGCIECNRSGARGYPTIRPAPKHSQYLATHVVWFCLYGYWPKQLNHTCVGVKNCINPEHLYEGDQKQNMQDEIVQGRKASVAGERNPRAGLLTEEEVREIIKKHQEGRSNYSLADEYGTSAQYIWKITNGKAWKHLR